MYLVHRLILLGTALWMLGGCTTPPEPTRMSLESAARTFMASYGDDIRNNDRNALGARYDPRGAHLQSGAGSEYLTADAIDAYYRDKWEGPLEFEWTQLSFEAVPPAAVMVVGGYRSRVPGQKELKTHAYSALLVLRDGRLRIRTEHATVAR